MTALPNFVCPSLKGILLPSSSEQGAISAESLDAIPGFLDRMFSSCAGSAGFRDSHFFRGMFSESRWRRSQESFCRLCHDQRIEHSGSSLASLLGQPVEEHSSC